MIIIVGSFASKLKNGQYHCALSLYNAFHKGHEDLNANRL